jgi:hypothetical protein
MSFVRLLIRSSHLEIFVTNYTNGPDH